MQIYVLFWNIAILFGTIALLDKKKILDAVHVEAARIVTGASKLCSIDKLFIELGWEPLQTRRNKHKLVTFYKIMHGLAPNYLLDLLPPIVGQTNNYALRNADHIQSFRSKTNLFSDSFFPSTIKAWNSLPNEAKELSSVLAFKNYLNRNSWAAKYQDCAIPDTGMKLTTLVKVGELMIFRYRTTSTNCLCACAGQNSLPL